MSLPLLASANLRIRECRHGLMAYLATDRYVGRSLDLYGEYVEQELDLLSRFVPEGGLAVDIGANIGTHTVFLGQKVGSKGLVVAYEPQRVIHQILCTNVVLNRLANVYALWEAAGDHIGSALVPRVDYDVTENFGGVSLQDVASGEQVRLSTLDTLGLPACHLIKVDVEGMEGAVLDGARTTILRHKPVLYLETDRPDTYSDLLRRLFDLGYRVWRHRVRLYSPDNFFANPEDVFGTEAALNVLAVPKDKAGRIELPELTSPEDGLDLLLETRAAGRH